MNGQLQISDLFTRRLLFFTGKGGVGKSTVVASLALAATHMGKRALIVEIDTESSMKRIFNVPFVGFEPMEMLDDVWAISINPDEALAEYIQQHVRLQMVADLIRKNSVLQYFFKTAPAVNELVSINKLYNLLKEREPGTRMPQYDVILVDLPATGHALSFLQTPQMLQQLVGVGALSRILKRYETLFSDARTTLLNLVTLPEEMPVTETIELYENLKKRVPMNMGLLFVNGVRERTFNRDEQNLLDKLSQLDFHTQDLQSALEAGAAALDRQRRCDGHLRTLSERVGLTLVTLPRLLIGQLDVSALQRLAQQLLQTPAEATS